MHTGPFYFIKYKETTFSPERIVHGKLSNQREMSCTRRTMTEKPAISGKEMYTHVDHMEPAMAYVPYQDFTTTYDLGYALKVGTVFPQLCKPFCGKRGKQK